MNSQEIDMNNATNVINVFFGTLIITSLSACGGGDGSTNSQGEVSDVEVVVVTPNISTTDVDRDPPIGVQFSGDIFAPSVDSDSFQLLRRGEPVDGAISFVGTDAIGFSVNEGLALLSNYTGRVTTAITDISGLPLANTFEWPFVTRDGIWQEPESMAQGASIDDPVIITDANDITWAFYRRNSVFPEENDVIARRFLGNNIWGMEQLVSNGVDDEDVAGNPQVVALTNGDLLVLWEENSPGGIPTQLSYNRYSQSSRSWGDSERINASAFAHMSPRLVADGSDNVMAVFEMAGMGPATIAALIYDGDNDQWVGAATVDELNEEAGHPRVSINHQGDAMVIWLQDDRVYSRRYQFSTEMWGSVEAIDDVGAGLLQPGLALSVDSRGNFTAVWSQEGEALSFSFIWSNRYIPGQGWIGADEITGSALGFNPQLVIDRDDNMLLVWRQDVNAGNILSSRFDALDESWSMAELLEEGEQPASSPRLTIDESGNAMAIWQQNRSGTFFDNNGIFYIDPPSIWVKRFSHTHDSWEASQVISVLGGAVDSPAITHNASGEITALWMHTLEGQPTIQSRRFD